MKHKEQMAEWKKTYGEDNQKQNKESVLERLTNPPKRTTDYQQQRTLKDELIYVWRVGGLRIALY